MIADDNLICPGNMAFLRVPPMQENRCMRVLASPLDPQARYPFFCRNPSQSKAAFTR